MTEYYHLKHGDIIQEGDEIDNCGNPWHDDPKWVPVTSRIGEPAPDPQYVSHRQYRRKIARAQLAAQGGDK